MWINSVFLFHLFIIHVKSSIGATTVKNPARVEPFGASLFSASKVDRSLSTVDERNTPSIYFIQHPVKSCHIGDKVENDCNTCLCSTKSVFECTDKVCYNSTIPRSQLRNQQNCLPSQLYVKNLITCICTKDGKWPHKSCYDTFQALPPNTVDKFECVPDTYVSIDCNVCRCGTDGDVILGRCTRNICESEQNRRAMQPYNANVYSTCDVRNWYSLAPCQFCYCVNQNKLMCNTGNYYSKNLELGTYNLRVCGKNLITEAIELIPVNDNALRMGAPDTNISSTFAPNLLLNTPAVLVPYQNNNIYGVWNREGNGTKTLANKQQYSSSEYYSDQFEDQQIPAQAQPQGIPEISKQMQVKAPTFLQGVNIAIPWKPVQDRQVNLAAPKLGNIAEETAADSEGVFEGPKYLVDELPKNPAPPGSAVINVIDPKQKNSRQSKNHLRQGNRDDSDEESLQNLKINLPQVLSKVFQLALRKSMVSLTSETKCIVGSTSVGKCNNMCFCLRNSKLLCTNNPCDEKE